MDVQLALGTGASSVGSAALKEWQTAVSAGVGFGGVILTLLVNASLARRAEDRRRRHDRLALRTVFRRELASLRDSISGRR